MRIKTLSATTIAAGAMLLSGAGMATSGTDSTGGVDGAEPLGEAREAYIADKEQRISEMATSGATPGEISEELGLTFVGSAGPESVPAGSNNDITLTRPGIFADEIPGMYFVSASWDYSGSPAGPGGPEDGFGVYFSRDVVKTEGSGGTLRICSDGGTCSNITQPWENTPDGTLWKFQDKPVNGGWSIDNGNATIGFDIGSGCLQVGSSYGRTWNEAAISSFTVGNTGISLTFSNNTHSWKASSALGQNGCG